MTAFSSISKHRGAPRPACREPSRDLRSAAQGIRVLNAATGDVRFANFAARPAIDPDSPRSQVARMRTDVHESARSNARGVPFNPSSDMAHITSAARARNSHCSSSRQPTASIACVPLSSEIPSFDCRSTARFRRVSGLPRRHAHALEFGFALADQHQRHVGQRRQIAAGAHASARGNDRRNTTIQQVAQTLGDQRPDSRKSLARARWRGSASWLAFRRAQGFAHTGGVGRTTLRCSVSRSPGDTRTSASRPTPVLTAYTGVSPRRQTLHHGARFFHCGDRVRGDACSLISSRHALTCATVNRDPIAAISSSSMLAYPSNRKGRIWRDWKSRAGWNPALHRFCRKCEDKGI